MVYCATCGAEVDRPDLKGEYCSLRCLAEASTALPPPTEPPPPPPVVEERKPLESASAGLSEVADVEVVERGDE